jgi:tetratricopeptide (TPR) repeat protein
VIAAALLLILITAVCIYTGRRRKYIAMGWLWYIGTLVPMTGLVQVGNQGMADRYMYIPMLGLLIIIAWAVKDFVVNRPRWKIVAVVLAAAVSASLILLTRTQVRYWENDLTLFGHTVKVTENNALAENNYGCALLEAGRVDEALPYLSDAVRLAPTLSGTRANIGKIFLKKGKPNEAIACFNELLRQNEGSAETHYCLALALGMQNKYDEAIKHLAKTLELDPNYPDTHNRMGVALMATGKTDEAIAYFNEATRISSEQTEAFANLGMAYTQLGKYEPAIQNLTKAAELKSDNIYVLNNLAWLLATGGNVSANDANKAIEFARRACELTGYKITRMLDTLAAAYAAGGRFDEAVRTAEQAVNIAKNSGQKDIADEIQKRVELYKAGKRYIQK